MNKRKTETTGRQQNNPSRSLTGVSNGYGIELTEQELQRVGGGRKSGEGQKYF